MAVGTYAENLKIDAACVLDLRLVVSALLAPILGKTVEDMRIGLIDINLVEKICVHEVAIALIVSRRKAIIFVKVPALNALE